MRLRSHAKNQISVLAKGGLTLVLLTCMLPVNIVAMTSSNGNIFRVTGPLRGKFTGHRWIPHTKASDAELWCLRSNKRLSKQSWAWWFETQSRSLWCHCNFGCNVADMGYGFARSSNFVFWAWSYHKFWYFERFEYRFSMDIYLPLLIFLPYLEYTGIHRIL